MAGSALDSVEREEIRAGIERGDSAAAIARRLGRHPTTVSREICRGGGRERYRAVRAQRRCDRNRRRPKTAKLVADRELGRIVEKGLRQGYSPGGIAAMLRAAGGATVAHETIYRALYSSTFRGIGLLPRSCLRTRRARRRRRGHKQRAGAHNGLGAGFRLIHQRPGSAVDRAEPGHWEGDLIVGSRASGSAIATLVERSSRLVMLAPLPTGHGSGAVSDALIAAFQEVPPRLRLSLTWDQGSEMRQWRSTEEALELPIYFCEPRSPWQRASNENMNRQLRFWFPKGAHITNNHPAFYDRVCHVLNHQPRRLFDWATAADRYHDYAMH